MWAGLLVVSLAAAPQRISTPPPTPAAPAWMLEVGMQVNRVDSSFAGFAGDGGTTDVQSYVWITPSCGVASSDHEPENAPRLGWHFSGFVLRTQDDEFNVRVEWQRVWENGVRLAMGPRNSQTLVVRSGQRVEFDRVAGLATASCDFAEASLQATISQRAAPLTVAMRGGRGGSRGSSTSSAGSARGGLGAGASAGTATGSGGVLPTPAAGGRGGSGGSEPTSRGGRARGAGDGPAPRGGSSRGTPTPSGGRATMEDILRMLGSYDVEVWLVHKLPDGTEDVQRQALRFNRNTHFAFPPAVVSGPQGPISVDVSGNLTVLSQASMPDKLNVAIFRRVRADHPVLDKLGSSNQDLPLPKETDVVSFELPPLQKPAEDLLARHLFSLRVKLTPVK